MRDEVRAELLDLARELNDVARSVIEEEGAHDAMYFLQLADGIGARPFERADRPAGEAWGREVADAVRGSGADGLVVIAEAWSADDDDVPDGGSAGDAADPDELRT